MLKIVKTKKVYSEIFIDAVVLDLALSGKGDICNDSFKFQLELKRYLKIDAFKDLVEY